MLELDANGLINGMTQDEHMEVRSLIEHLGGVWTSNLDDPDTDAQAEALPELAAAAERFRAFTPAQHHHFIAEYRPRALPIGSILRILAAFGLATPIA
jgi:hypothetical protein